MISSSMDQPIIGNLEGEYFFDRSARILHWKVAVVDGNNPSGSLEFTSSANNANDFFPIHITFQSAKSLCGVSVQTFILTF